MKRSASVFAVSVAAIGMVMGIISLAMVVRSWQGEQFHNELVSFLLLAVLFVLCRSLPLYLSEQCAIDMSFICIFSALLIKGPVVTAALTVFSLPFIIETGHGQKGIRIFYIFNTPPIKSLFNTGNQVISILIAGAAFQLLGGTFGDMRLPQVLLPSFAFIALVIILNGTILMTLFVLNKQVPSLSSALGQLLLDFWPNILAATPIGFFIAYLMKQNSGEYLALLFMLPLILARYAFKLYLDSKKSYYNLISTLSAAMEAKDEYTEGHSRRVEQYAEKIGLAMHLSPSRIDDLKVAALLHDIGKIGIDDSILRKPGPLTAEERAIIQNHPEIGLHIIEGSNFSERVKKIILHHHERYDGKGYPSGMGGDVVLLEAYILAVADTYDAITSDRPYRSGRSNEVSLHVIEEESGKQFHPKVAQTFISIMRQEQATGG